MRTGPRRPDPQHTPVAPQATPPSDLRHGSEQRYGRHLPRLHCLPESARDSTGGITHTTPSASPSSTKLGGRLQQFWENWRDLLPDSQVYHTIRAGVRWKFQSHPPLSHAPVWFHSNPDQLPHLKLAAQELVDKGAVDILPVDQHNTPGFYSLLFLRPKPSGEFRPIIDLSRLNDHIVSPKFKMETVQSIRKSLQPGEWCTQIDIKDAYLHIPVQEKFRKYLRFTVDGVVYQFRTLPFGLNVAPRIFTLILKPVLARLRAQGVCVQGYLDDWINRGLSPPQTKLHSGMIIQLLTELGWIINWDKCILDPTQVFVFVGLLFNLRIARVSPGQKGLDSLLADIRQLTPGSYHSARKISSVLGKAKHWAPYTPRGRLQLRKSQEWLKRRWSQSRDSWDTPLLIDDTLKKHLRWWSLPGNTSPGVPLHPPTPTQDMFTDACNTGWGAQLGTLTAQGSWQPRSRSHHINRLELQAVHQACLAFRDHLKGKVTRVHIDNTTAVAYIRKEGGTCSYLLTRDARMLLQWCDDNQVTLVLVHIAGVRNVESDRLSREGQLLSSEWSLSQAEFQRIQAHLGTPTIDLFAMAGNRVVPAFFSPVPHPEALGVDALSLEWPSQQLLYAYPPTALVQALLQKVRQGRGIRLILVASTSPTKPWHADLLRLALQAPLPVARSVYTMWQVPSGQFSRHYHTQPELLQLGAWLIASPR